MATDGFIVTNGEGTAIANTNDEDAFIHVFNTAKEVEEARVMSLTPAVYALVPIPAALVAHYIDARTNTGMTRAGFLHDVALRYLGTLPWPDDSGGDPSETAQSLADLDGEQDTWKE